MHKTTKLFVFSFIILFGQALADQAPATTLPSPALPTLVLDQVVATVYLGDKPDLGSKDEDPDFLGIITHQDVLRSGFDGKEHTIDELIEKKILCGRAQSFKMDLSDEDVDRKLEELGLTHEHQLELAEKWNYADLFEFKEAIKEMFIAGNSQNFEIESRLVIPQAEVQAHYEQNPIWLEAEYEIQTSFAGFNHENEKAVLERKLERLIETGKGYKLIWDDAIIVRESEISASNQFLTTLKPGQVYLKPVNKGFDLFKMVAIRPKRLQPLAERKHHIINTLRSELYPQVLAEIKTDLQNKSVINYPAKH